MARHMFSEDYDELAGTGLGRLKKHLLPAGDVEVRYWGGFHWGTMAIILRRADGKWSGKRLNARSGHPPTPLPAPKLGWPVFWVKAEKIGIFTLPDDSTIADRKGYSRIDDGYSTLVEYQKDGIYRAYAYNNPELQKEWRYAKPMATLDRFINSQFPTWRR